MRTGGRCTLMFLMPRDSEANAHEGVGIRADRASTTKVHKTIVGLVARPTGAELGKFYALFIWFFKTVRTSRQCSKNEAIATTFTPS